LSVRKEVEESRDKLVGCAIVGGGMQRNQLLAETTAIKHELPASSTFCDILDRVPEDEIRPASIAVFWKIDSNNLRHSLGSNYMRRTSLCFSSLSASLSASSSPSSPSLGIIIITIILGAD
jgi:hypothetical protein